MGSIKTRPNFIEVSNKENSIFELINSRHPCVEKTGIEFVPVNY